MKQLARSFGRGEKGVGGVSRPILFSRRSDVGVLEEIHHWLFFVLRFGAMMECSIEDPLLRSRLLLLNFLGQTRWA